MPPLIDYIESQDSALGSAYSRQAGKPIKDAFIALAAFDAAQVGLSGWGASYTPPDGGQSVVLTAANLPDHLVTLALKSKAYFWGNPSITGRAGKTTPKKYGQKFGTQEIEQETGERVGLIEIMFRDYIRAVPFYNKLVSAGPTLDFVLFTNATAIWIKSSLNSPVVHSAGYELGGNADTTAGPGSASITYYNENGDLPHESGVILSKLAAERVRFTFATAAVTNLTKEAAASGRERYRRTGAAAVSTITRALNESAAEFVSYSIKGTTNASVTNISNVTINSITGVITVASAIPLGTYEFQVVAENEVGVFGTYSFTLIIAS